MKKTIQKLFAGTFTSLAVMLMSISVFASGTAETTTKPTTSSPIFTLVLLGGMLVLMYFLMIRPQKKKEKEAKEMRDSIKPGDKIVTIGGVVGKVCNVKEDSVTIETGADKVRIKFVKSAISSVERGKEIPSAKTETKAETNTKEEAK